MLLENNGRIGFLEGPGKSSKRVKLGGCKYMCVLVRVLGFRITLLQTVQLQFQNIVTMRECGSRAGRSFNFFTHSGNFAFYVKFSNFYI